MSLDALRWAMDARPASASQKLLLLVLANSSTAEGEAALTFEQLENDTRMTIPTIRKCLKALAEQGFIKDSGKRIGAAGTTKVWQLTEAEKTS